MDNRERHDFNWTTDSRQYHKLYIKDLEQSESRCWFCGKWTGCNGGRWMYFDSRNWKRYRKYQCKDRN